MIENAKKAVIALNEGLNAGKTREALLQGEKFDHSLQSSSQDSVQTRVSTSAPIVLDCVPVLLPQTPEQGDHSEKLVTLGWKIILAAKSDNKIIPIKNKVTPIPIAILTSREDIV